MPRPHVVGIGEPEVLVKAVPGGQELRMVPEMPLAVTRRGIAARFQDFRDGRFVFVQSDVGGVVQDVRQPDTGGITAGHERGPRRGAGSRRRVKIGEPDSLGGHAIQMRRFVAVGPETADVAVAAVIEKDDHKIRPIGPGQAAGTGKARHAARGKSGAGRRHELPARQSCTRHRELPSGEGCRRPAEARFGLIPGPHPPAFRVQLYQ